MTTSNALEKRHAISPEDSEQKLSTTLIKRLSTQWQLPTGWDNYFSIRGNGMVIQCPVCDWKPGKEVDPWRRWKVLSNHIAVYHAPTLKAKRPPRLQRIK